MMRSDTRGVVSVAAAAAMWGTWALFLRPSGVASWTSAPIVFAVMGVLLLPLALRDRKVPQWDRVTVALLLGNAGFAAANVVTYFGAMDYTTIAVAVLAHYLAPVLVAVAAPWIDREHVPGARLAAVLATAGLVLVLEPWSSALGRGQLWLGAGLAGASAVFYAGSVFMARRLEVRLGARRTVAYHALVAAVLLAPTLSVDLAAVDLEALALLAGGAALPGALAGVLFVTGLGMIGSARSAVLAYLEPLVAVSVAWLVWGESLGPSAIAGACLIVGAGAWVAMAPRRAARNALA